MGVSLIWVVSHAFVLASIVHFKQGFSQLEIFSGCYMSVLLFSCAWYMAYVLFFICWALGMFFSKNQIYVTQESGLLFSQFNLFSLICCSVSSACLCFMKMHTLKQLWKGCFFLLLLLFLFGLLLCTWSVNFWFSKCEHDFFKTCVSNT